MSWRIDNLAFGVNKFMQQGNSTKGLENDFHCERKQKLYNMCQKLAQLRASSVCHSYLPPFKGFINITYNVILGCHTLQRLFSA
jgi:hypothetical protein